MSNTRKKEKASNQLYGSAVFGFQLLNQPGKYQRVDVYIIRTDSVKHDGVRNLSPKVQPSDFIPVENDCYAQWFYGLRPEDAFSLRFVNAIAEPGRPSIPAEPIRVKFSIGKVNGITGMKDERDFTDSNSFEVQDEAVIHGIRAAVTIPDSVQSLYIVSEHQEGQSSQIPEDAVLLDNNNLAGIVVNGQLLQIGTHPYYAQLSARGGIPLAGSVQPQKLTVSPEITSFAIAAAMKDATAPAAHQFTGALINGSHTDQILTISVAPAISCCPGRGPILSPDDKKDSTLSEAERRLAIRPTAGYTLGGLVPQALPRMRKDLSFFNPGRHLTTRLIAELSADESNQEFGEESAEESTTICSAIGLSILKKAADQAPSADAGSKPRKRKAEGLGDEARVLTRSDSSIFASSQASSSSTSSASLTQPPTTKPKSPGHL